MIDEGHDSKMLALAKLLIAQNKYKNENLGGICSLYIDLRSVLRDIYDIAKLGRY